MKNNFYLKKKNLYAYSFFPFIVSLFKEDICQIVELVKSNYPEAKIFFGRDGLDFELTSRLETENFFKNEEISNKVYNSLYIRINTSNDENAPYLIIELDQYSYNYIISGKDKKLNKVRREILKILRRGRVYRYIQNPFTISLILIIDVLFFPLILKFKDTLEKILNVSFSYITILLIFFLINIIFLIPGGKNRIFLKSKKEVSIFRRAKESFIFLGIFLLFVSLFMVGFFLKIL
ncbi:MAG: hypothetical protein ACP5QT_03195 [Brevinematia bacterium]